MDHGMETRMRLRGHFIGALTLAIVSIVCASVMFAAAHQMPAELSNLAQPHTAR
jgi:hypothetical protein